MTISIDDLTIREAREISKLLGGAGHKSHTSHPFVGKYVICRCYSAGVHAGTLVSQTGDEAILKDSRRLWSWTAKDGVALSGLAMNGLKSGKIDTLVPEIALTGVIETIPCAPGVAETINAA